MSAHTTPEKAPLKATGRQPVMIDSMQWQYLQHSRSFNYINCTFILMKLFTIMYIMYANVSYQIGQVDQKENVAYESYCLDNVF